jgi:uncharacterized membrane protein
MSYGKRIPTTANDDPTPSLDNLQRTSYDLTFTYRRFFEGCAMTVFEVLGQAPNMDLLGLVMRWLHILAAITAVGGTIFSRFVLLPSQTVLSERDRETLHAEMRARWSKIVAACIGFLLISGFYNFIVIQQTTTAPEVYRWYHPLFGIKFLLALAIFGIASLLSGKTPAAQKLRQNARFWMNLNIALAVIVVCISGILRTAEKTPQVAAPPTAQQR